MKRRIVYLVLLLTAAVAMPGWAFFLAAAATGPQMTDAAQAYLKTLDDKQRAISLQKYDSPQRVGWHFIPKDERKGLQVKDMNERQRKAAHTLLRSALSEIGYEKADTIMALEGVLHELEKNKRGGNIRDPERYYVTLFGEPDHKGSWGLSFEGHHLSLNFVVKDDKVASSTPTFLGANPGVMKDDVPGTEVKKGTRVLADEEQYAFELLHALSDEQRKKAVIDDTAPREIRGAGEPQPPTDKPVGLAVSDMDEKQRRQLMALVQAYAKTVPHDVAAKRLKRIEKAGPEKVHFAWAGPDKPGIGHYYRIQGPTFLIEFVNTQPDGAGNPANHIHCVWRDMKGDFALPLKTKKAKATAGA